MKNKLNLLVTCSYVSISAILVLWSPPAIAGFSTLDCSGIFAPFESDRQAELTGDRLQSNDFNTSRGLLSEASESGRTAYQDLLGSSFIPFLTEMKNEDKIFDAGVGSAKVPFDMWHSGQAKSKYVGFNYSIENLDSTYIDQMASDESSHFQMVVGDLNQLDLSSFSEKFQLGIDVYGYFSYSRNPAEALYRLLQMVKPGGRLYLVFDEKLFQHGEKLWGSNLKIEKNGVDKTREWFEQIHGAKLIEWETSERFKQSEYRKTAVEEINSWRSVTLERTEEKLLKPAQLIERSFVDGRPPVRAYEYQ